jgi:hypothetical protein
MNDTDDRSDVSVRNPASNPALKRLAQTKRVGHGRARHRVRAARSFYGYGMQHPYSCSRHLVVREFQEHGPPLPVGTPTCQQFRPNL